MTTYLIQRLLQTIVVIVGVTLLSFSTLHLAGDPTYLYVSERATEEELAATRAKLGFDKPLYQQYFSYMTGLAQLDLGNSLRARQSAAGLVLERLPATLELTIFAMLFSTFLAIPIGILSATKRGTPLDSGIMLFAMVGQSMPSFWLGIMSILILGLTLKWFPISGHVPFLQPLINGDFVTAFQNLPQALYHLVLPGITLGFFSLARNARLIRSSMLEVADPFRRHHAPRLSQLPHPVCDHHRPGIRLLAERCGGDRNSFLLARCWTSGLQLDQSA